VSKYTCEVFADGALAITENGTDKFHLLVLGYEPGNEDGNEPATDEEAQAVFDAVTAALAALDS
jgi:hypothetical protein